MQIDEPTISCKICNFPVAQVGIKRGLYLERNFNLVHCSNCEFYFVSDPELDPEKVYNDDYYAGRGADKAVNYAHEIEAFDSTIRNYEWQGIADIVSEIRGNMSGIRWLDYGCGVGGMLQFLKRKHGIIADGFDQGSSTSMLRQAGFKILFETEFGDYVNNYDVITAIEVLEHCSDPLAELNTIAKLLKPGGLFFYTTGNSASVKNSILDWGYYVPEVHISLFQPKTMTYCFSKCGLKAQQLGYLRGYESIVRFKILKELKVAKMNFLEKLLPWAVISRFVDSKYGVSAFPMAIK